MKIDILTLFPESFAPLNESILKRAQESGILQINVINIRDFSKDKYKKCDDYTFGGGAGMLMSGQTLSPNRAKELSKKEHLVFICGHYEGVDARMNELIKPMEISIGDYVVTGGELPTMVIIDCLARFIDGVITAESLDEESFACDTLEYPQYTRPQVFEGLSVPEVLISGNHKEIAKWRKEQALKKTHEKRPDLLKKN